MSEEMDFHKKGHGGGDRDFHKKGHGGGEPDFQAHSIDEPDTEEKDDDSDDFEGHFHKKGHGGG